MPALKHHTGNTIYKSQKLLNVHNYIVQTQRHRSEGHLGIKTSKAQKADRSMCIWRSTPLEIECLKAVQDTSMGNHVFMTSKTSKVQICRKVQPTKPSSAHMRVSSVLVSKS